MKFSICARLLVILLVLLAVPAVAEEVQVTITSISPEEGAFLTPLWVGFHDGGFDTYDRGAAVSAGLERLAEDGNPGPISDEFSLAMGDGVQGVLAGPMGPLFTGTTVTQSFDLDPALHAYFSYASMVIPSNDAFVSNGNPTAHRVFDTDGNFTPFTFYVLGNETLDAGTEVNDELESSTAALGQAAPDTGTDEGGVVALHPGLIPGGRILGARPAGQFIEPGYRLAKVTVERAPRTRVTFAGSGAQEVPPVTTDATAACSAILNSNQDRLTVNCEHNVQDIQAAHVHMGVAGENGAVLFPFADPASPISETFEVTANDVDLFLNSGLYVNLHSAANPSGEVRAQIAGCFDGPESLCLLNDRFQVSSTFTVDGATAQAQTVRSTSDAGQFTFFDSANVELAIKVLDACGVNDRVWVFAAGLTDVGVDITVTDTETGAFNIYSNAEGNPFEVVRDISAFDACN